MVGKVRTRCLEITPGGVRVENEDGKEKFIGADTVAYALGMKANSTLGLRAAAGEIPVYEAGDCVEPRNVNEAIKEGFMMAMRII